MKPMLAVCGHVLTKTEPEDKKKTNQVLSIEFLVEYNTNKPEYFRHAFGHIDNFQDAGNFIPMPLSELNSIREPDPDDLRSQTVDSI